MDKNLQTMANPITMIKIPVHSRATRRRCKNATLNNATKMITAPRNIWKLDANVKFKPIYMSDVAVEIGNGKQSIIISHLLVRDQYS